MQISKQTVFVDDYPNPGEYLAYHTRTQALVKISQELKDVLNHLNSPRLVLKDSQKKELETLHRMGIVVADERDDEARFMRFIEQKKYGIDQSSFLATILTTYNCNFACTYCFEESTRTSSQKLDESTSDLIIAWLQKKVARLGVRQLRLNYYGGEPLLNQPIMEYITTRMKSWCDTRGVEFIMSMQTNGALLTPEVVDKFIPLGLQMVQVSLDGTRDVNDTQRVMRGSGTGTFDLVIKNLLAVADKIKLTIAAGYDKGNAQQIVDLLNYLDSIGLLKKLQKFGYSPIHPTLGPKGHAHQIVSSGCLSNYETDTLIDSQAVIRKAMEEKGITMKSGLSASMCPVTTGDSGMTFDTQGLIFKCNAMLGHPDLAVGNVREDEYNETQKMFMEADAWKKCDADCPYAPLCNTGCRLFSFFKTQDWTAKSCERSYMDRFVPEAIKREYQNQLELRKKQAQPKEALV